MARKRGGSKNKKSKSKSSHSSSTASPVPPPTIVEEATPAPAEAKDEVATVTVTNDALEDTKEPTDNGAAAAAAVVDEAVEQSTVLSSVDANEETKEANDESDSAQAGSEAPAEIPAEEGKYKIDFSPVDEAVAAGSEETEEELVSYIKGDGVENDDTSEVVDISDATPEEPAVLPAVSVEGDEAVAATEEHVSAQEEEGSTNDELIVADEVGELADGADSSPAGQPDEVDADVELPVSGLDSSPVAADAEDREAEMVIDDQADGGVSTDSAAIQGEDGESATAPAANDMSAESSALLMEHEDSDSEGSTAADPADVTRSVNMEDSQAELLSSNLDDSMYRSSIHRSSNEDEVHVLESEHEQQQLLTSVSEQDEEYLARNSDQGLDAGAEAEGARKYVVTPSAFAHEPEPEVVAHIRPASAVGQEAVATAAESGAAGDEQAEAGAVAHDSLDGELVEKHETSSDEYEDVTRSVAESFVHVDDVVAEESDFAADQSVGENDGALETSGVAEAIGGEAMTGHGDAEKAERAVDDAVNKTKDAANKAADKAEEAISDAKDAASDAAKEAKSAADDAVRDIADKASEVKRRASDAAHNAASKAKDLIDTASKSVKEAASHANDKAHDAVNKAKKEVDDAEKAVRKRAKETSPGTLKVVGIVAAALAAVSGYYFRLPGRQNQQIGFAGGVASAILGLGALATAFLRRN
ncbi:hypothetical protein GQ54DRAFT_298962 [Martensiomyces pterosporus]|nr:hypothetical protein GQ54DRAFT_298962 [Martensiomyces pterosporus]